MSAMLAIKKKFKNCSRGVRYRDRSGQGPTRLPSCTRLFAMGTTAGAPCAPRCAPDVRPPVCAHCTRLFAMLKNRFVVYVYPPVCHATKPYYFLVCERVPTCERFLTG